VPFDYPATGTGLQIWIDNINERLMERFAGRYRIALRLALLNSGVLSTKRLLRPERSAITYPALRSCGCFSRAAREHGRQIADDRSTALYRRVAGVQLLLPVSPVCWGPPGRLSSKHHRWPGQRQYQPSSRPEITVPDHIAWIPMCHLVALHIAFVHGPVSRSSCPGYACQIDGPLFA